MRILLLTLALTCALAMPDAAKNPLLEQIERSGAACFTGKVEHTKPGRDDWPRRSGRIYFTAPASFAMRFEDGDCLVFHNNRFYAINPKGTFNISAARGPVAKLKNTLMCCLSGRLREVARLQNGAIDISDGEDRHVVSLTTRNRLRSGYKNITLCYRKTDLVPVELSVTDIFGHIDHYTIQDYKAGARGEESVFYIPNNN